VAEQSQIFFMCSLCFRTSTTAEICHNRPMLTCDTGCWGDECRKPLIAADGQLLTRAPRWWLQQRPKFARVH